MNVLIDYAKFQQAVIFGEENKYREALEIIYSLKSDTNDTHIRNLSESIENALQTLKREVPKDANVQ
jgi:translation initiation factor 2B subunit (eIF-2B alpha/beta/delta family)